MSNNYIDDMLALAAEGKLEKTQALRIWVRIMLWQNIFASLLIIDLFAALIAVYGQRIFWLDIFMVSGLVLVGLLFLNALNLSWRIFAKKKNREAFQLLMKNVGWMDTNLLCPYPYFYLFPPNSRLKKALLAAIYLLAATFIFSFVLAWRGFETYNYIIGLTLLYVGIVLGLALWQVWLGLKYRE